MSKKLALFLLLPITYYLLPASLLWAGANDCYNTYCHGNFNPSSPGHSGRSSTATWGDPNTAACGKCHFAGQYNEGVVGSSATPSGGSHFVHTSTGSYNYSCKLCHNLTIDWAGGILSRSTHTANKATDIFFSTETRTDGAKYALEISSRITPPRGSYPTTAQCTNLYCHSAGYNKTVVVSTPTWGNAPSGDCGSCHGAGQFGVAGSSQAPTGWTRHAKHTSTGTYNYNCELCHFKSVNANGTIILYSTHVNKMADVVFDTTNVKNANATYKEEKWRKEPLPRADMTYSTSACNNIYCHSNATGTYKVVYSTETLGCSGCHESARPSGFTTALSTPHSKHIDASSTRYNYKCYRCHRDTAKTELYEILYSSHHVDGNKQEVVFSSHNADLSADYDTDLHQCINLYCHGKITSDYLGGTPAWTPTANALCGSCHGSGKYGVASASVPPQGWKHARHVSTTTYNYSCRYCHAESVNWAGTISTATHVNSLVNITFSTSSLTRGPAESAGRYKNQTSFAALPTVSTFSKYCDNIYCHSNAGPLGGTTYYALVYSTDTITCTSCHKGAGTGGGTNLSQAHATHTRTTEYNFSCEDCHNTVANGTSSIKTSGYAYHVNMATDVVFASKWGGTFSEPQCSTTYCHGYFSGSGYQTNIATWNVLSTGKCGTCHGAGQYGLYDTNFTTAPKGWRHYVHTSTTTYNYPCKVCHDKTVSSTGQIISFSSHVANKKVDVKFATSTYTNVVFSTTVYRGTSYYVGDTTDTYNSAACSNTYCHSNGSPYGGTNVYRVVFSTDNLTCTGCHAGSGSGGGANLSVAHSTHTRPSPGYAYKCEVCHYQTAISSTSIRNYASHVPTSAKKNVTFSGSGLSTGTYLEASRQCNNTYCHSSGTTTWNGGVPTSTVTWTSTGTITCDSCHKGPDLGGPNYTYVGVSSGGKPNAHQRHTDDYKCNVCHYSVMTSTYSVAYPTAHVNGIYNVTASTSYSFSYSSKTTPTASSCSGISCHNNNFALWSDTITLRCVDCHVGTSDLDQVFGTFWKNGTPARISTTQWTNSGHGLLASTTYWSGNSGAGFDQGGENSCLYCHDNDSNQHKLDTNPFRLELSSLTIYEVGQSSWNMVCLVCHGSNYSGYNPAGYLAKNGKNIDAAHYGDKHNSERNGGRFCWDCHDPHGDREGTTGNVYMVQSSVTRISDGGFGYASSITTTPATFVYTVFKSTIPPATSGNYDYFADTSTLFDGICNVCHITADHYRYSYSDSHEINTPCTNCHKHDKKFAGKCDSCHGYPPSPYDGKTPSSYYSSYSNNAGKGAHYTNPDSTQSAHMTIPIPVNSYSPSNEDCHQCHDLSSPLATHNVTPHKIDVDTGSLNIVIFSTSSYNGYAIYNSTAGSGNSGDWNNRYCLNSACHFGRKSPVWSP